MKQAAGITLVEVVLSSLVLGMVAASALPLIGGRAARRTLTLDQQRASELAEEMLGFAQSLPYENESESLLVGLGSLLDLGGGGWGRADDSDDLAGWSSSPPVTEDGGSTGLGSSWRREVTVNYVQVRDPSVISGTNTGLLRIVVTVLKDDRVLAARAGFRSRAGSESQGGP